MKRYNTKKSYPSLYDAFDLGDRVKRVLYDEAGRNKEYKGIILAIDEKNVEIYWDTVNDQYRPKKMDVGFTNCSADEVFNGKNNYSPIKKERI